ncbi:STAS domain-containing protein [Paenalkalicoccus suaedae]|uniref:STAS domain-containing protein n=1 Tax=Paenalkalicoccus suaedae TaxID=2592382 RepID=A0A859FCX8_9BACI|nr:STAS domain-containing protein [Paenalkalicoccus suaedae]QKS70698.1 STAS domain-containing protein [Paenalkalicoccus suaedae]
MVNPLISSIGEALQHSKETIAHDIYQSFRTKHDVQFSKIPQDSFLKKLEAYVEILGSELKEHATEDTNLAAREWGKEFGNHAASLGLSAEKAMLVVPILRRTLYEIIRAEFGREVHDVKDYYEIADAIDPILDRTIYAFTQEYVEENEKSLAQVQAEVMELSVPVVPLTQEVAILPIIGTINSTRSQLLLTQALDRGRELKLSHLIVDLSGVHVMDTYVAQNLFNLHDALKVVGIKAIFSGLRPSLAQTLVHLGISFEHVAVVSNLKQALKMADLSLS